MDPRGRERDRWAGREAAVSGERTRQAGCSLRFNDSTLYRFNVLTFSVSDFSFSPFADHPLLIGKVSDRLSPDKPLAKVMISP